ncbi:MAG: PAS domain S-box protein, partial [Syntrophaceae bacterium]|nr:PAS domain S-box protein [Syntrophaceae bacterium]
MKNQSGENQELREEISILKKKIQDLEHLVSECEKAREESGIVKNRLSMAEIISRSGNWEFDLKSKRVFASDGARRIYGLGKAEWTIPQVQKLPLPTYRAMLDKALRGLIEENRPYNVEFRIRRPDTAEIVDIHSVAEYDSQNQVVFGTIRDITDYKKVETQRGEAIEALGKSESLSRAITDSAQEAILMMNPACCISFWNPAAEKIFGYTSEEALGSNLHQILSPNRFFEASQKGFERFKTTGEGEAVNKIIELQARRKDGKEIPVELSLSSLHLEDGWHALGIMRDITARKRAEEKLYDSRRSLEQIIEFLPDAILAINQKGKVIAWNRAIEIMSGVSKEDMLGKGDYEYALPFYGERRPLLIDYAVHPDKTNMEKYYADIQMVGDILIGESFAPNVAPAGIHQYATATVFRDDEGEVIAAIECIHDITERKDLAERLKRAEKMEALGALAGGVAHDLNNVLGVLVGYSELLADQLPVDTLLKRYADNILKSSIRGAAIIQDLLTLARRGVAVAKVVNLNKLVGDYFKTPEFGKLKEDHPDVIISTELEDGLLNIKGSPVHLGKTIMNLVSNALEAISGRGEVIVRTENRYLDHPIKGYDEMKDGDYAVLTVSDTGSGISPENMSKIFEPFYTKKVMGRSGTGLGLAVVWGTVKDHNGYIDVKSEPGEETVFTLYLPATREEMGKVEKAVSPANYMGKGQSILVVDDVREQRELAMNMLGKLGYQVSAVTGGEEAIEYLKSRQADLIVLDMIMEPGMDGLETYRKIAKVNPKQKTIIVSGFSENERVKNAQEIGAGA